MQTVPLKVEEHALALASSGFSTEKKSFFVVARVSGRNSFIRQRKFFKIKTAR